MYRAGGVQDKIVAEAAKVNPSGAAVLSTRACIRGSGMGTCHDMAPVEKACGMARDAISVKGLCGVIAANCDGKSTRERMSTNRAWRC